MTTLIDLQKKAKHRMKKDGLIACEVFEDKPNGDTLTSVKVYAYSKKLLNSQPLTGGLLVNGSRTGRPTKYPFASLDIGDSFILKQPLHKCHALKNYWQKKCGRIFRLQKVDKNKTRAWRIS